MKPLRFGYEIRKVRERAKLTQRAFAAKLGIKNVYVCNLEHDVPPSLSVIENIERVFGTNVYVEAWKARRKEMEP